MAIRPVIDADAIAARVAELGAQITADYQGREVVLVVVLKGSFVFAADLAREINLDVTVDFLGVRSYGDSQQSSGVVEITTDLSRSIEGKDVLLIEDIVDTGLTVDYLRENLETRQPGSLRIASLLHKPARTKVPVTIDYLGFTIDDVFVVGYGLDSAQKFRNLPFLGVVDGDDG
jgi:hypoxanthine phosphoribosyltransferase